LLAHVWRGAGKGWWRCSRRAVDARLLVISISWTLYKGIGVWGNNIPVGWAFGIINFVWWIGIGHAGTLISAILLLFQQKWRTSINRFAEAMTLFAVICALLFPLLHTGRPGSRSYWLMPYPAPRDLAAVQEPADLGRVRGHDLLHDLAAVLVPGPGPDLAALRDSSKSKTSACLRHARHGLARLGPSLGRVQVGLRAAGRPVDAAGALGPHHRVLRLRHVGHPGWHTTIFPPYFVAGAVFSGFAMVMTWMVPARHFLGLKHVVTMKHLENMNKIMLVTGMMVSYGYIMEHFIAWYTGDPYEYAQFFKTRWRAR
jgi:molybdopterin-containing oxidoreductase family membrane subunit